jgi:hypothetical protein
LRQNSVPGGLASPQASQMRSMMITPVHVGLTPAALAQINPSRTAYATA